MLGTLGCCKMYSKKGTFSTSAQPNIKDDESVLKAMRSYLTIGYIFGFFPIHGLFSNVAEDLSFRWVSLRSCYTLLVIASLILMIFQRFICTVDLETEESLETLAYICASLCHSILFLRQARLFPVLMRKWTSLERQLLVAGEGTSPLLKAHLDFFTFMFTVCFLGSVAFRHFIPTPNGKVASQDLLLPFQIPLRRFKDSLLVHIYFGMIWSFAELSCVVFSYVLFRQLKTFNAILDKHMHKTMPTEFWLHMRLVYNSLSRQAKSLDNFLSPTICLIYAMNVFFICFVLLELLTLPFTEWSTVYFFASSVLRTAVLSLVASSIHDVSKKPLSVLYSVPTGSFCGEAMRFQMEVVADEVALTGCHFFSVTRSFMLTIVGTVATYELVLLQFQSSRPEEFNSTALEISQNATKCACFY